MKYRAVFGWGLVIYAMMSLAWSAVVVYDLAGSFISSLIGLGVLVVVTTIAARSLHFHSWEDILPYSFLWGLITVLLDILLNVPTTGWQTFSNWSVWFGYALVVIVPLFAPWTRPRHDSREMS